MFWHQNRGSSIWGSRYIQRYRPRHTYYKMTKKNCLVVFRDQRVMKRGKTKKNNSILGPIVIRI